MSFINLEQLDQENSLIDYHKKINETLVTLSNTIYELQNPQIFSDTNIAQLYCQQYFIILRVNLLKISISDNIYNINRRRSYILRMKQQNTCLAKDFVDKIQQLQLEKEQLLTQWDFIQHIYERIWYIQLFNRIIFILIPTQLLGILDASDG